MVSNIKYCIFIIFSITIAGCGLFETRTPEEPITKKSNFEPPFTPSTALQNFINSISEKNLEDYIKCLSDTASGDTKMFEFNPSQEAVTRYQSLFNNWDLQNEKRYFTLLMNAVFSDSMPTLTLSNKAKFDVMYSDSAILTTDYFVHFPHNNLKNISSAAGTLQLLFARRQSGWWSIQRWIDTKKQGDTTETWSILKAQFY